MLKLDIVSSGYFDGSLISPKPHSDVNEILIENIDQLNYVNTILKIIGKVEPFRNSFRKSLQVHSARKVNFQQNEVMLKLGEKWIRVYKLYRVLSNLIFTIFLALDKKSVIIITNNLRKGKIIHTIFQT